MINPKTHFLRVVGFGKASNLRHFQLGSYRYRSLISLSGCGGLDWGGLDYGEFNSKGPKPYFCMSLSLFVFICLYLSGFVLFCLDLFLKGSILIKYMLF